MLKVFLFFFVFSQFCWSQDERFFRKIFADQLVEKETKEIKTKGTWQVFSPAYQLDINKDGFNESFVVEKNDGEDWIHIYNLHGRVIFSGRLHAKGLNSHLYKISIRQLSKNIRLFLLYFYEGHYSYLDSVASARLYFLTIEGGNFKTLSLFEGPRFWEEKREREGHYHRRGMKVSLYDYNGDGVRDLSVKHQFINRVFYYSGKGNWRTL